VVSNNRACYLLTRSLIVPLSRNIALCAPVEEPEKHQTWGWCPPSATPFRNGTRILCGRVPCLPSPRAKPPRRLGECLWHQRVSESIDILACSADSLFRWIYAQFIAVDANFKLKLKNRRIVDPELGSGWSYFVENSQYARHVARNPHERDVCLSFNQISSV